MDDVLDSLLRQSQSSPPAGTGGNDTPMTTPATMPSDRRQTREYFCVFVDEVENKCLGYLVNKTIICLKPAITCKQDHESEGFFQPPAGGAILVKRGKEAAFSQPMLPYRDYMGWYDDHELLCLSTAEWRTRFAAASLRRERGQSNDSEEGEARLRESWATPRTPIPEKQRARTFASGAYSPSPRVIDTSPEVLETELDEKGNSLLAGVLCKIDFAVNELSRWAFDEHKETKTVTDGLQEATDVLFDKTTTLQEMVGDSTSLPIDFDHPTIWGSLGLMANHVAELNPKPPSFPMDLLQGQINKFIASERITRNDIDQSIDSKVKSNQARVIEIIKNLMGRLAIVEASPVSTLDSRVQVLENLTQLPQGSQPASQTVDITKFQDLELRTNAVEKKVAALKGDKDSKVCRFGNTGIGSPKDASVWLTSHYLDGSYGIFVDFLSFLELVRNESDDAQDQMLTNMKRRKELQIRTSAEARVLFALQLNRPALLFKGDLSADRDDASHLTAVTTERQWFHHSTGVATKIRDNSQTVYSEFKNRIDLGTVQRDVTRALATEMLSHTMTFTSGAIQWFRSMFDDLTVINKFSKTKAFALTTQCFARMIDDMVKARGKPFDSIDMDLGAQGVAAEVLHASLRVHDVMKEYLDAKFADHRSVSAEYIKFLAVNSGFDAVSQLVDRSTALADENKRLKQQVQAAEKKADTASNKVDTLTRKIDALTKDIEFVKKNYKRE